MWTNLFLIFRCCHISLQSHLGKSRTCIFCLLRFSDVGTYPHSGPSPNKSKKKKTYFIFVFSSIATAFLETSSTNNVFVRFQVPLHGQISPLCHSPKIQKITHVPVFGYRPINVFLCFFGYCRISPQPKIQKITEFLVFGYRHISPHIATAPQP